MRRRSEELLQLVGLEAHIEKPVATYSSGMKQRLAIARGLIAEPEVLILDEPTRTLDPVACEDLIDLIIERLHRSSGKTILIATHRLDEAIKLCNKVMVINEGRVISFDQISDLALQGITLAEYYRRKVSPVSPVAQFSAKEATVSA
jgi:ABC-2 type transport system ATP-binding protein